MTIKSQELSQVQKKRQLREAFLPNLDYAPMPVKSIANPQFAAALKNALSEVADATPESSAEVLLTRLQELMDSVEGSFGQEGENDYRAAEAFELLFVAANRLSAIAERRE